MNRIYLLAAFLTTAFSYGQSLSGFVTNPSFEDGSAAAMVRYVTLDNWKLEGANAENGNSASIQTTNVHSGDGSNTLEVTNFASNNTTSVGEWKK